MSFVFEPQAQPAAGVLGGGEFPVRRIFCIGRNYADHVKEMGGDPKSDSPVFFTKPADAIVGTGTVIPYPAATKNLHYEGELVIALGAGGRELKSRDEAAALVFGHAAGCDLTRRDLQAAAKKVGGPWDSAKGFDCSAPLGLIARIEDFPADLLDNAQLVLKVNGEEKQKAPLSSMIWSAPEIIIALSALFELRPGDLIFTGTPEGVGPLTREDHVEVTIGVLPPLEFSID
ncbi:MAG: fumarylacetoacetate hydrolase family protein [Parvularculaceae bacterium]|nr:fumarylacetoacetate hydrolase family protein [Parvularculaceae bacterium]